MHTQQDNHLGDKPSQPHRFNSDLSFTLFFHHIFLSLSPTLLSIKGKESPYKSIEEGKKVMLSRCRGLVKSQRQGLALILCTEGTGREVCVTAWFYQISFQDDASSQLHGIILTTMTCQ